MGREKEFRGVRSINVVGGGGMSAVMGELGEQLL